jgi:conjugative transposon TraN protein
MKRVLCQVFVSVFLFVANAQQPINSVPLAVTTNKTTSLVFPFPILHVDRGTEEILIEQVNTAKNVLLVKAAVPGFRPTNLTILTEDCAVYAFDVYYDSLPSHCVFRLPKIPLHPAYTANDKKMNLQELDFYSRWILNKKKTIRGIRDAKWDMQAGVKGIFIKGEVIFYQLELKNFSSIDFSPEVIRFYIRDKKKSKRTATQDVELKPVYTFGALTTIPGNEQRRGVFAFEKFTIPDAKYLFIEIMEKNGGRNLKLRISNNKIIRAQTLPSTEGY